TGDGSAQTNRGVGLVFEMLILGNDAGIPGTSGSSDHAGDEVGKDAGENQLTPALSPGELAHLRRFFQVSRDCHGPAMTLNRMYHCVPSSKSTMEPSPKPPPMRMRTSNTMGNNAVAGTEAAICASGCAMRDSLGLKPMATPAGIVQAAPMVRASITRRNVAPAPMNSSPYSPAFNPVSMAMARVTAYSTARTAITAMTRPVQTFQAAGGASSSA